MSDKHPDLEQLERYLHQLPASLEGPDARRLEAILAGVRRSAPVPRPRVRSRHAWWWIVLALSAGMATAAIWHQVRKLTAEPVATVEAQSLARPAPEAIPHSGPEPARNIEEPLPRPDRRFIPK